MKLPKFKTIKLIEPCIRQVRLRDGRLKYLVAVSKGLSCGKRPLRRGFASNLDDARKLKRCLLSDLENLESLSFQDVVLRYIETIKEPLI